VSALRAVPDGHPTVERLEVAAYTVPTDAPEGDGTLRWSETTIVVASASADGQTGIGYSYTEAAAAALIASKLREIVEGADALAPDATWERMRAQLRNAGRPGLCSCALSAVDIALWDLKARLLGVALADLLGRIHRAVPIYGSGGFTTYSVSQLQAQLAGWVEQGIPRVKMKVGAEPGEDLHRVELARAAIGVETELFVDANGAYGRKQALAFAEDFAALGVSWFEEPVSSDDLEGLRLLRDRAPAGIEIAAGEYGYDLFCFRRLLEAGAVDVLQVDVTRCGGVGELLRAAALCAAAAIPFSAHTAPQVHAQVCCAVAGLRHLEYFHDHVRIERLLFDGVIEPRDGALEPAAERPGSGLELRRADAERYAA
jgi:L-alanine-DL-glutamate epimerase-like enolase superfamily enzyme